MDSKTKKFQTILLIILGVGLALGLMIFSGLIKTPNRGSTETLGASGKIVIWGPFPSQDILEFINAFNTENKNSVVSYVALDSANYDQQLLEAFARGQVPDIVILPHSLISRYKDKMIILNEEALPTRNFKDLYSQGAEIFRIPEGTIGLPLGVDPLVMYYNRNLLELAGFVNPPYFWNEDFLNLVKTGTRKETNGLSFEIAVAPLGEAMNIRHVTPIISAIAMQLGSLMTLPQDDGVYEGVFSEASLVTGNPVASALEYYTNFSNPSQEVFTWSKDMPEARDAFTSGKVMLYFGFASELLDIQRKNPNLNFDVATIPQIRELNKSLTYGNFYALAIPKISQNTASAFTVAGAIANGSYTSSFLSSLHIQPVRKDLLSATTLDSYQKIFNSAAIVARAWIMPNPALVDQVFSDMVNAVTSGRLNPARAVTDANSKITDAF